MSGAMTPGQALMMRLQRKSIEHLRHAAAEGDPERKALVASNAALKHLIIHLLPYVPDEKLSRLFALIAKSGDLTFAEVEATLRRLPEAELKQEKCPKCEDEKTVLSHYDYDTRMFIFKVVPPATERE